MYYIGLNDDLNYTDVVSMSLMSLFYEHKWLLCLGVDHVTKFNSYM